MKAMRLVVKSNPDPADIDLLERYYTAQIPDGSDYRRRDILTLLNNFNGEIDRARRWANGQNGGGTKPVDVRAALMAIDDQLKAIEARGREDLGAIIPMESDVDEYRRLKARKRELQSKLESLI